MLSLFHQAGALLLALSPIAIIVAVSALFARRGALPPAASKGIADGMVYLFLPCLIFDKITVGLQPAEMPFWWALPLTALGVFIFGGLLTLAVFRGRLRREPDLFPLAFMHNAGFIVLAIGQRLIPDEEPLFAAYTFLFVLGHSPLLWSIGKYFISGQAATPFAWRQLVTPPLIANVLAVSMAVSGGRDYLPEPLRIAIHMLGSVTIPASLVVLGASLSMVRPSLREDGGVLARAALIKLILMPAVLIGILHLTGLKATYPVLAFMLVLQAAVPQATNFIVLVRTYGGNLRRTGTVLLGCYILSFLTVPLWLAIWENL